MTQTPIDDCLSKRNGHLFMEESDTVELIRELPPTSYSNQMLLRAVNFRLIVAALFYPMDVAIFEGEHENFVPLLQRLI